MAGAADVPPNRERAPVEGAGAPNKEGAAAVAVPAGGAAEERALVDERLEKREGAAAEVAVATGVPNKLDLGAAPPGIGIYI